jgi:hypothetical protein
MLSVTELFRSVDLKMHGPVDWGQPILEPASGIYVITLLDPLTTLVDHLPDSERVRWNVGQEIIYIGKAKRIRRRIREFYRHQYGAKSPHRGGQAIKLLNCPMMVYWSLVADYAEAEHRLIKSFQDSIGSLPFANRVRAARMRTYSPPRLAGGEPPARRGEG